MIIAIISYFFVSYFIITRNSKKQTKFYKLPSLKMTKEGIIFYSRKTHRIYIQNSKCMQIGKRVYVKNSNKLLVLENVDRVVEENSFLYFKSCGETKILIDCSNMYKYFNLKISSPNLEIENYKCRALNSLATNPFQTDYTQIRKYIHFLRDVLNIQLTDSRITVKANKFNIPLIIVYKLNGKFKCVKL